VTSTSWLDVDGDPNHDAHLEILNLIFVIPGHGTRTIVKKLASNYINNDYNA